jgi:outer membrane protein OmpA-like peptidoglycan-associated protein/Tol biopolymer transport system component
MKNIFLSLLVFLLPLCLPAQQQSSKSKSSDKLYEKGQLRRNAELRNASDLNTKGYEFSPSFYQNGMVYVSFHKNGPIDPKTGKPFFELFFAETNDLGMPQKGRPFSLSVNSQAHEGPVAFSRDNNLIYFTRNSLEGGIAKPNSKGEVPMKIYEARRGKYDWEGIKPLPFNSDEYTCFHPSLSADGKRLFFSSNMPGGYGGYDLYYTERKGDDWSKPVNLGADINSAGNEVFPFLHETNTLFFSSDGRSGEGGLDIFMIDISGSAWGNLLNLGTPFNSAKDDLGFIINEEGTRGYLASDRPGGNGGDDIYMFQADGSILENETPLLGATIIAFDEQTNERIPNAGVRIFQQSEDGFIEGNNLYDVELLPAENGEEFLMKLVRKTDGQLGEPTLFTNINGETLTELRQGKKYLVLVTKDGYQSGELSVSTAGLTAAQTLRVPMKVKNCAPLAGLVSVQGFTTAVPNALVRIVNQTNNTEEIVRSNASGNFDFCLQKGCDFIITAEKQGYSKGTANVSTKDLAGSQPLSTTVKLQPLSDDVVKEPIREGSVIVLEKIYYDFNQYIIRKGAGRDLDALAQLMKQYPSMEIELIAHTDSRGTEQYNLDLSLKRAESAKRYLVQKGIGEDRIRAFGYGESQIRNRCTDGVDCSDDEHQFNRRTEVKVVRIDEPVKVEYGEGSPTGGGGK